jgi:TIR domain
MSTKPQGQNPPRVFISFAAADRAYATQLRQLLVYRFGANVFMVDELSAGEDWPLRFRHQISTCDLFLVMLSATAIPSSAVQVGLGAAWALGKPIVAVTIQPAVKLWLPVPLKNEQVINVESLLHSEAAQQYFAELLESATQDAQLVAAGA